MNERYDLCVIGAGTAGYAAADAATNAGRRVVVISREGDLGGTCIRRGCMPAKTLLTATEALGRVRIAGEVGVTLGEVHADAHDIVERKNELVRYFVESKAEEFAPLHVVYGDATFVSESSVRVDGALEIEAERFIIATGSTVIPPNIPGLEDDMWFTSNDALDMVVIPPRILVLGAGPVGCEFAQYFSRLGCTVTLVQAEHELLRNEDADLAAVLRASLTREGITIALNTRIVSVERRVNNLVITSDPALSAAQEFDAIMIAAERRPYLAHLGLAAAGISVNGDMLVLDEYLRTTNPRVYAAGDVVGNRYLVHAAEWAGTLAAANAFSDSPKPATYASVETHAIFTQPQIAVTGISEHDAIGGGIIHTIAKHPFSEIGKAVVADETTGFVKMIADRNQRVIGVAIVGAEAIDLINEGALIVAMGMTVAQVTAIPHLHPTMGEIYVRVAEDLIRGAGASTSG